MNAEKSKLFEIIRQKQFVITETALYLDTHPGDKKALAHYHSANQALKKATQEYEKRYGPMTIFSNESRAGWQWADSPWPWEMEG